MKWQCRIAPSLGGGFEGTPNEVWGTTDYLNQESPTVFFGCYGFPDFYAIWRHKGIKEVFWAGTDIIHFENGYWLEEDGKLGLSMGRHDLAVWMGRNCGHWVENAVERDRLFKAGILARIQPSFLGDIKKFKPSFKKGNKLYSSVSGNNFEQYGWDKIHNLAMKNPNIEFHLYGNTIKPPYPFIKNVIIHGRVPIEQMNKETKEMQGAIRMTEHDGFSEILAKSILWGQYPVSLIEYPYMLKTFDIAEILNKTQPNLEGRSHYQKILNRFPWNTQS